MIFRRRSQRERGATSMEAAAEWAMEDASKLTPRQLADRDAWRAADAENDAAYRTAVAALKALDRHAAQPEMLALRSAALAVQRERHFPLRVVAAVVLLAVGAAVWWTMSRTIAPPAQYSTAVGERSTITLPDGSEMVLNTASSTQVSFKESERQVRLLKGEALFTVAHGKFPPFRVYAGDRVITAVGTVFDVRLDGERVQVTLLDGRVHVDKEMLSAGETLTAAPEEPVRINPTNVERAVSWRSGLLIFEDILLADAVAEINRYTTQPITVESAGEFRISGTFRTGEPDRFAQTMAQLFPLDVRTAPDGHKILISRR